MKLPFLGQLFLFVLNLHTCPNKVHSDGTIIDEKPFCGLLTFVVFQQGCTNIVGGFYEKGVCTGQYD